MVSLNKALLNPYFWWGGTLGGFGLTSHEQYPFQDPLSFFRFPDWSTGNCSGPTQSMSIFVDLIETPKESDVLPFQKHMCLFNINMLYPCVWPYWKNTLQKTQTPRNQSFIACRPRILTVCLINLITIFPGTGTETDGIVSTIRPRPLSAYALNMCIHVLNILGNQWIGTSLVLRHLQVWQANSSQLHFPSNTNHPALAHHFRKSSESHQKHELEKKTDCWNMRCDFFERLTSKFYPRFPSKKQPPSLRVFCDLTGPTVIPSYLAPPFTTPPNRRGRQAPTPEALPRSVPWRRDGRDELLECPPFFRPTKLWSKGT